MKTVTNLRLFFLGLTLVSLLTASGQAVNPILGNLWRHQEAPFNTYCPTYDGSEERCLVGCVATACESILTHYGRTITLTDTLHGWKTDHYTIDDILPGETVVCDNEDTEAVARLGYWCAVACRMNFGLGSSGANVSKLVEPLRQAMGLKYVHRLDHYYYSPEKWRAIINNELRCGRPVLYAGHIGTMSGHAFVIDGLREDGLYHVNWGYGGSYDEGWHELDELFFASRCEDRRSEDLTMGFFANHEMLLLHPDDIDNPLLADSIQRTGTEIEIAVTYDEGTLRAGNFTPVTFTAHNTTTTGLTTNFVLFSNEVALTDSLIEKGDPAGLFMLSLSPGERRTVTLPMRFSESGQRILRIVCDDDPILWESAPVNILPPAQANLSFTEPAITTSADHPGETISAHISLSVSNTSSVQAGTYLLYCLFDQSTEPGITDGDIRHFHWLYTPAGRTETILMDFRALKPDTDYTLLLRQPWTPILNAEGWTFHTPTHAEDVDLVQILPSPTSTMSWTLGPVRLDIDHRRKSLYRE